MDRIDIEFNAEGTTLRGWLYRPEGARGAIPAVVMAHGLSGVKEQYLGDFAEVFAAAGLAAVVYDHRNLGASDGEPRQEADPWAQIRDYRHAITYTRTIPGIDPDRIGVWGTSYSGGHVLVVGAIDRRVKAVVSQVPLVDGWVSAQRLVRPDFLAGYRAAFDADREARFAGKEPATIPVTGPDPLGPGALCTPDTWKFFSESTERAPAWRNEVTMRTVEMLTEYNPGSYIERVSPTPLLVIVAAGDAVVTPDVTLEAFNRAREPKRSVILQGGHFDAYTGAGFQVTSSAARDWFVEHLRP